MKIDLNTKFVKDLYQTHDSKVIYAAEPDYEPEVCEYCGDSDTYIGSTETLADVKHLFELYDQDEVEFEEFVEDYSGETDPWEVCI